MAVVSYLISEGERGGGVRNTYLQILLDLEEKE